MTLLIQKDSNIPNDTPIWRLLKALESLERPPPPCRSVAFPHRPTGGLGLFICCLEASDYYHIFFILHLSLGNVTVIPLKIWEIVQREPKGIQRPKSRMKSSLANPAAVRHHPYSNNHEASRQHHVGQKPFRERSVRMAKHGD
ncbi:hypothetical protein L3X38_016367 [Prunus dulcis]|uniref:Uncharacterized protein n=1 Tax=Prunus dulcis TaxID=3755 RepID=A0AAD4W594_PRUDU|nr:hypothetical protein L3X38_016367 [Prunus dulcis]